VLTTRRDGRVLTLVLDDPGRRNALDYAAVAALNDALAAAAADPGVGCVVITGAGPAFSAGGDLRQFRTEIDTASATDDWETGAGWERLMRDIPRLRVPVVAAVNGPALAGACGLVAACDIALAARSATLGVTEVRLGLFPIVVLPALIRAVGPRAARELALTGRIVDAEEAARLGLVHRVVADDELPAAAAALAAELAGLAPTALALGKSLLAELMDLPYDAAVRHGRAMRGAFLHTADLREGVDAFLEKRRPVWGGGETES
jgi:enoyl-CoA hydratase/carnithine racemase